MKKILILNQGNTENYGDIAIKSVLDKFFSTKYDIDFIPYWDEKKIFGLFFSKFRILYKVFMKFEFLRNIFYTMYLKRNVQKQYDYIIVGGGELLSSHRGFNTAVYNISKFFNNKSVLYMIGVSGNGGLPLSFKRRYKKALSNFKKIYVRDKFTKEVLQKEYNIESKVYPDVVFAYNKVNNSNIIPKTKKTKTILLSPICYYDEIGQYLHMQNEKEFADYIIKLLKQNSSKYSRLIIAPTVKDDLQICKIIYDKILEMNLFDKVELCDYVSLDYYTELLRNTQKVISCRMHGLILAKVFRCEIETIVFKNKLFVFKQEHQLSEKNILETEADAYKSLETIIMEDFL